MKIVGIFVTAVVVLAAAQAAAVAIGLLLVLALVYGMFAYPRETLGLFAFGMIAGLIERHPLPSLAFVALAILAGMARRL